MLKIKPLKYKFCPLCGAQLLTKQSAGGKRKYCPSDNWTYYPHVNTAVSAIIQDNGKVLLVKRKRAPYKDTWMFPAGFIDFGEHPDESIVREVKEETRLRVKNSVLYKIQQSEDDPRAPGHFIFVYKVKVKGNVKNLDKEENSQIGWFDIENPPRIGWIQHKEIIKALQDSNLLKY